MKKAIKLCSIVLLLIFFVGVQINIDKGFNYPFKPVSTLRAKDASFMNFWGLLLGMRKLSADWAWINVLQYYGTHFEDHDEEHDHVHEHGEVCHKCIQWGVYEGLFSRCQAVIRLDPYFHYAYLYGAGALAFNHERFDEAIELLEEGVQNNPDYWRFRLYLGAIAARQKGEYYRVIPLLEQVVFAPDAPTMLRSILAQIYENQGQYAKAKLLWEYILASAEQDRYIEKAKKHLEKLDQNK
ncbi:MAG: tetratricopeptide repeat protein [bacterium]